MRQGRIGDITEAIIDYRGKTPPKSSSGVKLLTAKVIKNGTIDESRLEYISDETYASWMRRGYPRQWDILLTVEAPLGEAALLRSPEPIALAQRVILLRGDPSVVDQRYLFAALRSPTVQERLIRRATGTTVLGIKQSELRAVEVPLPALPIQRKIAAIISAFDDLIENNNGRIKLMEEMAQRIYHEWFVDFRYPGHEDVPLVGSTAGPTPKGWNRPPLFKIAAVTMGQSPPSGAYNHEGAGLPFHQGVGSYGQFFPKHDVFSSAGTRLASDGDVLVSVRAPVGRINLSDRRLILGRGLCGVRATLVPRGYLINALRFVFQEEDQMGNGSIFKAVTRKEIEAIPVVVPDGDLARRFAAISEPVWDEIRLITRQTETLRATRDLLLPRLISGQIDVENFDLAMGDEAA